MRHPKVAHRHFHVLMHEWPIAEIKHKIGVQFSMIIAIAPPANTTDTIIGKKRIIARYSKIT